MMRTSLATLLVGMGLLPWMSVGPSTPPTPTFAPTLAKVDRPVPFFYDIYTFRGYEDATTVVAAIAVPVGELRRERRDGRVRCRFDVPFRRDEQKRGALVPTEGTRGARQRTEAVSGSP